ncbi:glycine cleavage system protein GcvH [Aquipuribacter nitratireducens]|uniref:Glycine cleavage system H protein n=1 Tax=Aquipuribacter nitratireducens TaxID=650104 RepID=A0ABW0GT72_9MICO
MDVPEGLRYTDEHEWVASVGEAGEGAVRVGITDYAQDALGDIVFVELPAEGTTVTAGQPCGEVESTKSVSELYAPVSGTVTARNESLEAAPEQVNGDPYGAGWMFEIRPDDPAAVEALLDAATYRSRTEG